MRASDRSSISISFLCNTALGLLCAEASGAKVADTTHKPKSNPKGKVNRLCVRERNMVTSSLCVANFRVRAQETKPNKKAERKGSQWKLAFTSNPRNCAAA